MTLRMGDAVTPANLPPGLDAYAGYVDGRWADYQTIAATHHARLLSIAVTAADDADCLDVETGDATNAQAPQWVARQRARGVPRPCLYTSLSNAQALIHTLDQAGVPRASYRLWTAHYDPQFGTHMCKPSCGLGFTDLADGTQWTDHSGAWDESLLADDFFATPVPLPLPKEVTDMLIGVNPKTGNLIVVGAAKDNGDLLVFECIDSTNPTQPKWSVIDVTDNIGKAGRPPAGYQVV